MSSELCKNIRDRLGLWGTLSESEVAGNVSGLERLRSARFNKVSDFFHSILIQFVIEFCAFFP